MPSDNVDLMRLEAFGGVAVVGVASAAGGVALACAVEAVDQTVAEFDQACSRFRPDSELSALNASSGRAVSVGPVLLEAVSASLRAARLTAGDVDPTIGDALITLGYDRDFAALEPVDATAEPTRFPPRPIAAIPGWRTVVVDVDASTVRLAPGVTLDLGATAKALAADRAAARAFDAAGCGVLVSFSGDLAIAGPPPADGWRVRVTDDHRAGVDAPGQWISLHSGGLATSSTAVRRWRTSSGVAHHLIDPATGQPANSVWRTATVTARSCLDANIASTAAVIRGAQAIDWLEGLGLPTRLVRIDGTVRHLAGWPSEGDDLPASEESVLAADRGASGP
ncbi:MAG TPA: FAD:protein FMN transferase [Solirubrobacteraceae bacterium]|nr:FAD:protein FMN transferase [Solirubrobacteraceae bacterium]